MANPISVFSSKNFNLNQLLYAVLHNVATDPGSGIAGQIIYVTNASLNSNGINGIGFYVSDGNSWIDITAGGTALQTATSPLVVSGNDVSIDLTGTSNGDILQVSGGSWIISNLTADNVTYTNTTSGLSATEVQSAIDEIEGRIDTIETNLDSFTVDLTSPSNDQILVYSSGKYINADNTAAITSFDNTVSGLAATNVKTAIEEVYGSLHDVLTLGGSTNGLSLVGQVLSLDLATTTTSGSMSSTDKLKLNGIESGAKDDQIASEVPVTPTGNLSSSDVQTALQELQGDIDTLDGVSHPALSINASLSIGDAGSTNSNGIVLHGANQTINVELASATNPGTMTSSDFTKLGSIEPNAKDDQIASEVSVTPTGNLGSSNVQSALQELQGDIDTLDGLSHTQNTDTGTTSSTFQIDNASSGPIIKNNAGELQVRNSTDTGYANIRIGDLYVEGTQTTITSNTVNIGDSEILLNSDITTQITNSDGGIAVKLLGNGDTSGFDAKLEYIESSEKWIQTIYDETNNVNVTYDISRKISIDLTDGASNTNTGTSVTRTPATGSNPAYVITHKLDTKDVVMQVRDIISGAIIETDTEATSNSTITVRFNGTVSPDGTHRITVIG